VLEHFHQVFDWPSAFVQTPRMELTKDMPRLGALTQTQYQNQLSLEFAKYLGCLAETGGPMGATKAYLQRFPHSIGAPLMQKAAVAAGSTTDANWAAPLAGVKPLQDAFIAIARQQSLLGRIAGLRRVPFGVKIPIETGGANYQWVPENQAKPASAMAFANGPTLTPTKHAAIVAVSQELVELSVAGMEGALRDTLLNGLTSFTDRQFLDPAIAAVAGKNPASVTNGTTPIPATASYQTDVQTLLNAFFAANPNAQNAALITNAGHASQIRSWNSGGGVGVDVIVSDAALGNTIAMNPAGIVVADNGATVDISREASIQMNDAPDNPVTATTVLVSAFQMNMAFFRVERTVNWATAIAGSVKYLAA